MRIESEDICTGMIILGKDTVSIYSNSGVAWECDGEVVFEGKCYIGNDFSHFYIFYRMCIFW